jgi:signal peptidase II
MFASGGALLLLDQWSKAMVRVHLPGRSVSWGPVLRIRYVTHWKDSYKQDRARIGLILVWFAGLLSSVVLHRSGAWFQSRVAVVGLGLALGGAAGNLLDILWRRCVVNFVDLRWWPVFNLADVAIVAGLLMAFWPSS